MTSEAAPGASFGDLLRSLRLQAGLSRERLAELAGISMEAVRAYERKLVRAPRKDTLALLADALKLNGAAREEFESAALPKRGPTSHSTNEPRHNLPWQPSSFIGRQREIDEISALLAPRRLVTIVGSGGIGKTRTSLEVASRLAPAPRDGVWFAELAAISDHSFLLSKLASVLGVSLPEQTDLLTSLIASIKTRELLLIIDNCEHVLESVREVTAAILQRCPQITLLATSRERLGVAGERLCRLPTLPVPAKGDAVSDSRSFAALELFVERASEHDFDIPSEDLGIAAEICRRLDGIALAIELAAARLPILGLSELRSQLAEHFKVISGARHDLPTRQRTLNATISWSYECLNGPQRVLFHRLAVFASGWTLEAASSVCSDATMDQALVHDALFSLVEKSLVVVDLDTATPRYSFFESTRAYALEQLTDSGEGPMLSRRHAGWIATFADRIYAVYGGVPRGRWAIEAVPEIDNALAALEWAFGPNGDTMLAGHITGGLQGFWRTAGLAGHGRRYVSAALELIDAGEHPVMAARLLIAQIRYIHGTERKSSMITAISLAEGSGDQLLLARCYAMLSGALLEMGAYSEAIVANDKASLLLSNIGMRKAGLYSNLLCDRIGALVAAGRLDEARAAHAEALSIAIALADEWSILLCQCNFIHIELLANKTQQVEILAEEAISIARRIRATSAESSLLDTLTFCRLVLGHIGAANVSAQEMLELAISNSDSRGKHFAIQYLATVAAFRGKSSPAARLLGFVDAWCQRVGYRRQPDTQKALDILVELLHKQLTSDEISMFAEQGAHLTEDAAISEAMIIRLGDAGSAESTTRNSAS